MTCPDDPVQIDQPDLALPFGDSRIDQIYYDLRRKIIFLTYEPGERLSETALAKKYDVSRTPMRQVIHRLVADDLVNVLPQRGSYVSKIDAQKIAESQFMREALESAIVSYLTQIPHGPIQKKQLHKCQEMIDAQKQAAEKQDPQAFYEADDAYHYHLALATGFTRPGDVMLREKLHMDRLRVLVLKEDRPFQILIDQHQKLLDMISARQTEESLQMIQGHLRAIMADIEEITPKLTHFFKQENDAPSSF